MAADEDPGPRAISCGLPISGQKLESPASVSTCYWSPGCLLMALALALPWRGWDVGRYIPRRDSWCGGPRAASWGTWGGPGA